MSNLFRTKWMLTEMQIQSHAQCEMLYLKYMEQLRAVAPDSLALNGRKVYSQNDEDGIVEEIFHRLKIDRPIFIEIGCGNGLENNTHYMALKGSSGVWIDGSKENIQFIRSWEAQPERPRNKIVVAQSFVTKSNVVGLLENLAGQMGEVPADLCDFLAVDVDGNDVAICQSVFERYRPKVVCVEYNAILPPAANLTSRYADDFAWSKDDYMGASLRYLNDVFEKAGYRLICCNIPGVNAFFVRKEFAVHFPNYPLEKIYMPPRYNLLNMQSRPWGHRRSHKYLVQQTELIFK